MKTMMLIKIFTLMVFHTSESAEIWDGYDYNKGSYVEIEKGNLVRDGETIEIYDYEDGEYKYVDIESVNSYGSTVEVEVIDQETGETRTLDMDD